MAQPRPDIELCIPKREGFQIIEELARPLVNGCERSVLALVGISRTQEIDRVLIRKLVLIPDEAYFHTSHGSAWSPLLTGQALSQGMQIRAGLLLIHAHPGSDQPRLSSTDRDSFGLLLPRCIDLLPQWPHGSVVLGDGAAVGGLVWLPESSPSDVQETRLVRWLSSPVVRSPSPRIVRPRRSTVFSRQVMLIGAAGQSILAQSALGVVGLGGGGSHVVQQAAHMGFGRLVLMDPDRVEESNLSRLVGAGPTDVGRLKTEVMADLVRKVNPDIVIEECSEKLPSPRTIDRVKTCDILVSAVDSYTARNEVQKIAWRHLLPVIDVGLGVQVRSKGEAKQVESVAGHVHAYIPGGPCMWCSDLVTEVKLEQERGGQAVPYAEGEAAPQVIQFNGLLASQAMVEAMQIITGFLPPSDRPGFLVYRGVPGELVRSAPERRSNCPVCDVELGAGDTVW